MGTEVNQQSLVNLIIFLYNILEVKDGFACVLMTIFDFCELLVFWINFNVYSWNSEMKET